MPIEKIACTVAPSKKTATLLADWLRDGGSVRIRTHATVEPALAELRELRCGLLLSHADSILSSRRAIESVRAFHAQRTRAHWLWALTSVPEETHELALFDAGFDDVSALSLLSRPMFRARARAALRHVSYPEDEVVDFGPAMLIKRPRLLVLGHRTIKLARATFEVLCSLMTRPTRGLTPAELSVALAEDTGRSVAPAACRVRMSRLRSELGPDRWLVSSRAGAYVLGFPPPRRRKDLGLSD